MRLVIEDGLEQNQEGYGTQEALRRVFEQALNTANAKNKHYGGAWRHQGWMGNLARIMSKVARLRAMCWMDFPIEDSKEPVKDTALDLINLSAFFLINNTEGNRWGDQ